MLLLRVGDQIFHGSHSARVGQGPHADTRVHAVTHLELLGVHDKLRHKVFVDAFLHQKPGGRHAHLAGIAEFAGRHGFSGQRHVGVVKNHNRGMATQLHGHALHVQAGHGGQLLAHRGRARERDLADRRVRNQVRRDVGRVAVDQVNTACRHTSINEGPDQLGR